MKRLLAYLFIVLGLGFIFNTNAHASNYKKLDLIFCENDTKRFGYGTYIRDNVNGKCPTGYEIKYKFLIDSPGRVYFDVNNLCYYNNHKKGYQVIYNNGGNCNRVGGTKIKFNSVKNEYYTYIKIAKTFTDEENKIKTVSSSNTPSQNQFNNLLRDFKTLTSGNDFYVFAIDQSEYFYGNLDTTKFSKKKSKGLVYSSKGYRCETKSKITETNKKERIYKGNVTLNCSNGLKFEGKWKQYGAKGFGSVKEASSNRNIDFYFFYKNRTTAIQNIFELRERNSERKKVEVAKKQPSQTKSKNKDTRVKYVFCRDITYGTANIQLNKCSSGYISLDADKYVFTKLLGDNENEDYINKQNQFNGEIERLLDEFKVYKLDANLILKAIKKNKQLNKYFSNLSASAKNRLSNQTMSNIATAEKPIQPKKKINKILVKNEIITGFGESIFSNETTSNEDGCYNATQNAKLNAIRKLIKKRGISSEKLDAHIDKVEIIKDTITKLDQSNSNLTKCVTEIRAEITLEEKKTNAQIAKTEKIEFNQSKDADNDPPVISIASNITVGDKNYTLEGTVKDKSNKVFIEIDGETIQAKNGKFSIQRYSPIDEKVKIVAIDQWGNKSKPKIVNIKINVDETIVAEKLEPLNPSNIKIRPSNNKVALIIGVENYTETAKASFASLDAKYFYDYAIKAFGTKKQNINLMVNEEATYVKTNKALKLWLKSKVRSNQTDLIIFFAGHGLASNDGKELYLLPQDGDPNLLDFTALSRTMLFQTIIDLNPKSVTMFLDTCYSGVSRDEEMLLASARPIRIIADEQEGIPNNFTIFSASKLDQISSGLENADHGIFSYYLMKGLEGNADANKDKKITNGELLAYMDQNVSQKASELGRQQNPSLAGDPDKVLINYR